MLRKIVIIVACCIATEMNAQDGTVSPYSFFGIGELRSISSVDNQMMGGISTYTDSIHINLNNPTAYGKLRLTAYSAGLSHSRITLNSASDKENTQSTDLDYLAIGFPVAKKLGVGFGLVPYSSVNYNIVSESTNSSDAAVTNQFSGVGGLNRVYFSMGYEITKNLSLGFTANYNYGVLDNQRTQVVEDVQFGTLDNRTSRVTGFDFNYALNYTPTFNNKYTLYSSVRVNTQGNLSSRNTKQIGSFSVVDGRNIEVVDVDLSAQGTRNTSLRVPTRTTVGLGFGENKKWFLGAEYGFQQLSTFRNDFLEVDNFGYEDASSVAIGGYFIPDYTSFTSYFKRITYRAGVRIDNTGLIVNNQSIDDFGITFGVGLPLSSVTSGFSNINVGFEIGKRGTTEANLIEENYFKFNIGLSLNDRWFRKTRIN